MHADFVLEFVVRHIACGNTAVRSSPVVVSIPGFPSLTLKAKSATIGKRITFTHSRLLNLKTSFVLVQGHGDHSVRASCQLDFFAVASTGADRIPIVYKVGIGMDRPSGDRFGVMTVSFQLMPLFEFRDIPAVATPPALVRPTRAERTPDGKAQSNRISVTKQESPRSLSGRSAPFIPALQLAPPLSHRSTVPSIHERYMKRNELWLGNHSSTRTDRGLIRPSSRGSSETGGARFSDA
jgi:hypothetical protein